MIIITFILGVLSAYFVSFYEFPLSNFFSWTLILAFAVPGYIYAFSIIAFFENYGTAFSILTYLFGENNYNLIIVSLYYSKTIININILIKNTERIITHVYIYIYTLTYVQREREREKKNAREQLLQSKLSKH